MSTTTDRKQRQTARRPSDPGRGSGNARLPATVRTAMVRFTGEVSTKSRRTRSQFLDRLAGNLRDAYERRGIDAAVEERWSRFYVRGDDPDLLEPLGRLFGVSSYSPVDGVCEPELERIVSCGAALYADRVKGKTYAVRARRSGTHEFDSYDVQNELGAALNPGAEVDLDDPQVTVHVEVRPEEAWFYSKRVPGPGGLPLGVQGRAVALLSGGFDSAVAAWMTLRRGVELDYVFCNLGGGAYLRMVLEVAKHLADEWSHGSRPRLHEVDFGPALDELRSAVKTSYWQVVLKRLMYRTACRVAEETGAEAIVTGESVGQVSSQTLRNLHAIDTAADLPVLRPLAGFDKEEIVDRARRIGTYDLCARVREYCAVVPDRPVTAATPGRVDRAMAELDLDVLDAAVEARRFHDLGELSLAEIAGGQLFIDDVPADARVIDVRPEESFDGWHWPGAERRDLQRLTRSFQELDPESTYVLVCAQGLQTAHLAERMQAAGYEAYSFAGGARGLRARAGEPVGATRDGERER